MIRNVFFNWKPVGRVEWFDLDKSFDFKMISLAESNIKANVLEL